MRTGRELLSGPSRLRCLCFLGGDAQPFQWAFWQVENRPGAKPHGLQIVHGRWRAIYIKPRGGLRVVEDAKRAAAILDKAVHMMQCLRVIQVSDLIIWFAKIVV